MSFSPVDLARAFDAPLLPSEGSENGRNTTRRESGDSRVQYGIVRRKNHEEKMVIGDVRQVEQVSGDFMTTRGHYELLMARVSSMLRRFKSLRIRGKRRTSDQV